MGQNPTTIEAWSGGEGSKEKRGKVRKGRRKGETGKRGEWSRKEGFNRSDQV